MKISKLLVLSALCLFGLSAQATIVNGVRQAPDVATVPFEVGDADHVVYLYNTSAGMFFTEGNTWGTRGCVGPHASAVKVYFSESGNADGTYLLNNYICIRSTSYSWKCACGEAEGTNVYTDQSSSWGRPYWKIVPTTGNGFRLQTSLPIDSTLAEGTAFMGYDINVTQDFYNAYAEFKDDAQRYPVTVELTATEGHFVDWALVAPADYEAAAEAFVLYDKSKELKTAIDDAKAKGVDVLAEEQVYLNEASTVAEMDAAIANIQVKVKQHAEQTASPTNPQDMTSLVTNPSYANNNTGWSGTTPGFGYTAAEFYQKNFNHYQDLKEMPNGVYAVKVNGFFRPGSTVQAYEKWPNGTDLNAFVYAKAGVDSTSVAMVNIFEGSTNEKFGVGTEFGENGAADEGQEHYVPNNMQAAEDYFNHGRYENVVYIGTDDGTLRIGVYKNDTNFGMNWTIFDNWQLSFLGNSAEAFSFWMDEMKKSMPDYSNIEDVYTEIYLTAFNEAVAAAKATTKAEASAAIKVIQDAKDALELNIDLWKQYKAVLEDATTVAADQTLDPAYTGDLADWAEYDGIDDLNDHKLTNEQLQQIITEKKGEIEEARKHPFSIPADMTRMLTNPDFEQKQAGWTGFKSVHQVKWGDASQLQMPTTGGTATNTCAEAFSAEQFDLFQEVKDAPVGVYEISVQGFCRHGRGDVAWQNHENQVYYSQPGNFPVYVYLNAKQTPFVSVFSEPVEAGYYKSVNSGAEVYVNGENEYPDGMISSAIAFSDGKYVQKAYGLVAKAGDLMRIGVKGKSCGLNGEDDNWVIFDNFKLTYWGFEKADVIQPILQEEIAKAEARAQEPMGKGTYQALTQALNTAKAVVNGTDGLAMFNALNDLFELDGQITESVAKLRIVQEAVKNLEKEIEAGNPDVQAEAGNYYETINGKLENHDIDESEIEDILKEISRLITQLRLPVIEGASDLDPVDMTKILRNAGYDEDPNGAVADKWLGTPLNQWNKEVGNAEFFNQVFDYYLEFEGMPQGVYDINVQGFYRAGFAENDYARLDSAQYNKAFLYAVGENREVNSVPLTRLTSQTYVEDANRGEGYVVIKTDTIDVESELFTYTMVCNTMATAGDVFADGFYKDNVVTVKVGEDGYLRFGLKKDELVANDWTIFDNWKISFYGADSEKQVSGDAQTEGIADVNMAEPVRIEFFTLDGRKAGAMQKGIVIMKQTLGNGAVVVRKIRK